MGGNTAISLLEKLTAAILAVAFVLPAKGTIDDSFEARQELDRLSGLEAATEPARLPEKRPRIMGYPVLVADRRQISCYLPTVGRDGGLVRSNRS